MLNRSIKIMIPALHCSFLFSACRHIVITSEAVGLPDMSVTKVGYTGCRSPFQPLHFIALPVGAVRPEGWLKKYLSLQKEKLTGRLREISVGPEKKANARMMSGGAPGREEAFYRRKGYGDRVYILNGMPMIEETRVRLDAAFASRHPGSCFSLLSSCDERRELWANRIMRWRLRSYEEYSRDSRVTDLTTGYFSWETSIPDNRFLKDYRENSRGLVRSGYRQPMGKKSFK